MLKGEEAYWICMNRDCGITAVSDTMEHGTETHICRCGSQMKKKTHPAIFSYLEFLKEEQSSETREANEKEETPCEN